MNLKPYLLALPIQIQSFQFYPHSLMHECNNILLYVYKMNLSNNLVVTDKLYFNLLQLMTREYLLVFACNESCQTYRFESTMNKHLKSFSILQPEFCFESLIRFETDLSLFYREKTQ